MRYKALPTFLRGATRPELERRPPSEGRSWADWPATILMVLAVPAVLVPLVIALATASSLAVTPSPALPGAQVRVTGANLPPHLWGQLVLDGGRTGLPRFHTDGHGAFSVSWTIPSATTLGDHILTAISVAGKNKNAAGAGTTLATTVLHVGSPATQVPTPTIAPTAVPTATPTASPTPTPSTGAGWVNVVNDQFDSGGLPAHWTAYDGPYGSGVDNCAVPSHVTVSGGSLHLLMAHETSGKCGAAWYTAGLKLVGFSSVDQRVSVRFRIVDNGVSGHRIIPMRWPDDGASWPAAGEEDDCEGDALTGCSTYLHYATTNQQVSHAYVVDLSLWHTLEITRVNHTMTAVIDGSVAWTYSGSSTTLPDTLKHVVLQQECWASGCPSGTVGSEDIQVDWIRVDNPSGQPAPTPVPTASATSTPPASAISHVFMIVMENHSYAEVAGLPYTSGLVSTWAQAANYHAITHPSLPNYLDLYAGSDHGITTDCNPSSTCHLTGTSLGDELTGKGLTYKGYFEGMPAPCTITDSGTYRAHHNPFIYFDEMWQDRSAGGLCARHVVPLAGNLSADLASAATTPSFAFVKPDNCNDGHDCSLATSDAWLSQMIPSLLASPACTVDKCLVILTWDEDDGSQGNQVLTVFAGDAARTPYTDLTPYTHYGLLRTIEDIFGLAHQVNDASATPMTNMLR
jgi:phosphatidylinositol-3-phosphatase